MIRKDATGKCAEYDFLEDLQKDSHFRGDLEKLWIKWWQGTDALKLVMYPPGDALWKVRIFFERLFWKVAWPYCAHWVNTEKLIPYLVRFGIPRNRIKVHEVPWRKIHYARREHASYNIIYYLPRGTKNRRYKDWIYGKTIIEEAKRIIQGVHWIELDGMKDMSQIYPIVDCYIKVNRHPGSDVNLIAKECQIEGIPVFMTDYLVSDVENAKGFKEFVCSERRIV